MTTTNEAAAAALIELETVRTEAKALSEQFATHHNQKQEAQTTLDVLTKILAEAENAYAQGLAELTQGAIAESALDKLEKTRDNAIAELERRQPRLEAVANALKPLPIVHDAIALQMRARIAVRNYWNARREEIEAQARAALPIIKLAQRQYGGLHESLHIVSELKNTKLPEVEAPFSEDDLPIPMVSRGDRVRLMKSKNPHSGSGGVSVTVDAAPIPQRGVGRF